MSPHSRGHQQLHEQKKRRPFAERRFKGVSAGHALLVTTYDVLAAYTAAIPIAPHADIDIPSSGAVPAINTNVDSRAPI